MNIPTFLDFDRALSNATDGHPLEGHYPYRPPVEPPASGTGSDEPTPAQTRLNDNFFFVYDLGADVEFGLGDVLNTRAILIRSEPSLNRPNIKSIIGPWTKTLLFSDGLAEVETGGKWTSSTSRVSS